MKMHDVQVERTYTGPQTGSEDVVEHMKSCNPRGPLIIQVAKLFPKSDVSSFGKAPSLGGCMPSSLACCGLTIYFEQAVQASVWHLCGVSTVLPSACAPLRDARTPAA